MQYFQVVSFKQLSPTIQVHRLEHMPSQINWIQQSVKDELGIAEIWAGKNQRSSWGQHANVFLNYFFKVGEMLDKAERANDIVKLGRMKLEKITEEKMPSS